MPHSHHRPHALAPPRAPPKPAFLEVVLLFTVYRRHRRTKRITAMSKAEIDITLPTTRIDGSPLPPEQIGSVNVFDSASSDPAVPIATLPGPATEFITDVLPPGEHRFTTQAVDVQGQSSDLSNEATVNVPAQVARPSPPTITARLIDDDSVPMSAPPASHVSGPA